ncbi:MAG: hypothetical protein B7Y78_06750 [Caulobacter sp. 35-67-4]|nr:MAG: hypothetical protein B7Y78_06750 [Caulobacter sp. 35-67-4]
MAAMDEGALRVRLAQVMKAMDERGLNRGTSGNVSARCGAAMLVTPSGVPASQLTPEQMVLVQPDGSTAPGALKPSSEWRMHQGLLDRRPDINAVVHCHSRHATILACAGRPIPAVHYMVAVSGHKGIASFRVTVSGREAHSSLTHLGVSANMAAIKLMAGLVELSERLEREADPASPFTPKGATLTIGQVNGGTAVNILARECVFIFDLRTPPGLDPMAILADFFARAEAMDVELKARAPEAGVRVERRSLTPSFAPEVDGVAEAFARRMAGDNGPGRVVPYAAEAGQFQGAGFSTVICGPGSIDQAHQPDEFVEISQMQRGAAFMARLIEDLSF